MSFDNNSCKNVQTSEGAKQLLQTNLKIETVQSSHTPLLALLFRDSKTEAQLQKVQNQSNLIIN